MIFMDNLLRVNKLRKWMWNILTMHVLHGQLQIQENYVGILIISVTTLENNIIMNLVLVLFSAQNNED